MSVAVMSSALTPSFHTTTNDPKALMAMNASGGDIICLAPDQVLTEESIYCYDVEADAAQTAETDVEDYSRQQVDPDIPFAVASLQPLLAPPNMSIPRERVSAHPILEPPTQASFLRPEFLFASAIKPTPDSPVGLSFKKRKGGVYISHVKPGGLFCKSGLQAGDRVVAVNNVDCILAPLRIVASMVENSPSTISLCVRNKDGDPHCVLSSVQKPSRDTKLKISFQNRRGALTVSKVNLRGLFAGSLLMPDHRVFLINGQACDNMSAQEAADLTGAADRVTIVSRARGDLATVLSVEDSGVPQRWSTVAIGAGVAAAALSAFGSMA